MASYDRTTEDLGNLVAMDHLNLTVDDQSQATLFYITGLGLTRDPYMSVGLENMWVNAGRQQFHLPTRSTALTGRAGAHRAGGSRPRAAAGAARTYPATARRHTL